MNAPITVLDRMWAKVKYDTSPAGCWLWVGSKDSYGYGKLRIGDGTKRMIAPHRVSYMAYKGIIPEGLELDHLCRTPACVNPLHLRAVNKAENVRAGIATQPRPDTWISHCKYGHDMSISSRINSSSGKRYCKTCQAMWARERRSRKVAA